uniref:T-complex protein 1 subunit gamma n=1 Tax=Trichuris muris TaxID=70415 RepID=A0A5S6QYG0_TRIMR
MLAAKRAVPIILLSDKTVQETGRDVQLGNIEAARSIAEVIRTCLGPRAMLKMLVDTVGGTVITSDGNAVLREIEVPHPAAKSMIEISRTQDQETGDGTTSVIILAAEILTATEPFLTQGIHPVHIIRALQAALTDVVSHCHDKLGKTISINNEDELLHVVRSCVGSNITSSWMKIVVRMGIDAVKLVTVDAPFGKHIDIKRYVRVEKVPGGQIEESKLVKGVVLNKDILHASMPRRIKNPRIILLDSGLEFHKFQSGAAFESSHMASVTSMLETEEKAVKAMCDSIIEQKPNLVFCEKGVSDLAQHYLLRENISVIRRIKRTDSDRLAKVTGATIVHDPSDLTERDVGTKATEFYIEKIGDEYFTFVINEKDAKACTLLLRGPNKDILNEMERNLQDALHVVRNVFQNPKVLPGGGATEMAIAQVIKEKADSVKGEQQFVYRAVADAFEIIPRTLLQNSGADVIRTMTALRAKHTEAGNETLGIDGVTGEMADMNKLNVWDPLTVRVQVYKTAIETAILLLRIDEILSGVQKKPTDGDKEESNQ